MIAKSYSIMSNTIIYLLVSNLMQITTLQCCKTYREPSSQASTFGVQFNCSFCKGGKREPNCSFCKGGKREPNCNCCKRGKREPNVSSKYRFIVIKEMGGSIAISSLPKFPSWDEESVLGLFRALNQFPIIIVKKTILLLKLTNVKKDKQFYQ